MNTWKDPDRPTVVSFGILTAMWLWCSFLVADVQRGPNAQSFLSSLRLYGHMIPAALFYVTANLANKAEDSMLVWLIALLVFRYWRTLVSIFFWFLYKPAMPTEKMKLTSSDCTVVVPTVGPQGNAVFAELVVSILVNKPSRLIFSANTDEAALQVEAVLPAIIDEYKLGITVYQKERDLGPTELFTDIRVTNANVSNKRRQVVRAFEQVDTDILVMVDDTAIWHHSFLPATLPAFNNTKVGIVGTRKWVRRQSGKWNPEVSLLKNVKDLYWNGFWNAMGAVYLIRHNFEIQASNAADGGVFCVSGRSCLIRAEIVKKHPFAKQFLNEFVLGFGPVTADDDNFITRYIINNGWDVKIQCSEEATMTTQLGKFPKFPQQCLRWSRTTFRQNPIALFKDRTIWWKWPLTVWTTYFPWMYNAALVWDGLAIFTLLNTNLYMESSNRGALLSGLVGLIWGSKLVKTIPWWWAHPMDFLLYFLIPAYPLFAYYHSVLKIWTAFTFWNLAWSGRKIQVNDETIKKDLEVEQTHTRKTDGRNFRCVMTGTHMYGTFDT